MMELNRNTLIFLFKLFDINIRTFEIKVENDYSMITLETTDRLMVQLHIP